MALPVYNHPQPIATLAERRAAIAGWVYAPFRVGDLMAGLGGPRTDALNVEIYDGDTVADDVLMYRQRTGRGRPVACRQLHAPADQHRRSSLDAADRHAAPARRRRAPTRRS
jgi:hypothetical protein